MPKNRALGKKTCACEPLGGVGAGKATPSACPGGRGSSASVGTGRAAGAPFSPSAKRGHQKEKSTTAKELLYEF